MNSDPSSQPFQRLLFASLAVALVLSLARVAHADDRSLVHSTQQNPYVFIILDTSGSMHQSTACTGPDMANGYCTALCIDGDCLPHLMGDDPNSKIYTAKQAIYDVMLQHPDINFGFGHFDQQGMHMSWKYWWYQVASTQPGPFIQLDSGTKYPASGQLEIFGEQAWNCTDARADSGAEATPLRWTGCPFTGKNNVTGTTFPILGQPTTPQPAHLDNAWESERVRRYPKLNDDNSQTFWYYITELTASPVPIYRVTFTPVGGQTLGTATMQVKINVDKCTIADCSTTTPAKNSPQVMNFQKANETLYWEPGEGVTQAPSDEGTPPNGGGAFFGDTAREIGATGNRSQLDMNYNTAGTDDTANDQFCSAGFCADTSAPVVADPFPAPGRPALIFESGDFIPLDWKSDQQALIMTRMAPNLLGGATIPDFGVSDYFADHRVNGESALRLKNPAQGPLAPDGGTPTGHVMLSFLDWLQGGAAPTPTGWIQAASAPSGDPFFPCKPMYILLVTDGQASSGDGDIDLNPSSCQQYHDWVNQLSPKLSSTPAYACCVGDQLRNFVLPGSGIPGSPYPIRTYVVGLGLTTLKLGTFNNMLQCVADQGGTGNRHFYQGNKNTVPSSFPGYPKSDNPSDLAGFCSPSNPCDGPGPLLPTNPQSVAAALESVISLISSQESGFAAAAVPSIQSNVQNKSIIATFKPVNQPIWIGRVDAYSEPIPTAPVRVLQPNGTPTTLQEPDPSKALWSAGGGGTVVGGPLGFDQLLQQGLNGFDTAASDFSKRRIYYADYSFYAPLTYASYPTYPSAPAVPGERLFLQMPALTDTGHLFDLENALGLCGPGYTFYPPKSETCADNSPPANAPCAAPSNIAATDVVNPCPAPSSKLDTKYNISGNAQQAVTFTEKIKTYLDPATLQPLQYLLGDVFHSDPQVLGQPVNVTLFDGNVDLYQNFANAQRFRRKVLYFGSNDGELHAIDAGTVQAGKVLGQDTWIFNDGTGKEIFAFVPRTVMPTLNQLAIANAPPFNGGAETFMVDGPPHLAEGFFDATGGLKPAAWHSLVIGGLREGGRGYYALDVTQPDTLVTRTLFPSCTNCTPNPTVQMPDPTTPNSLPNCMNGGANCGQVPYPTPLWEFTDSVQVTPCSTNCPVKPSDDDPAGPGVGQPDLGQTWSRPNSGRVRICNDTSCTASHEQWVVVFGGGMDPNNLNSQGNWLYMLDMATGQILYKRMLNGSVPSEPAAVDTGQDGYIDTLYVGTTAGHLYKLDLSQPAPIDSVTHKVSTSFWKPFEIFDTQGRPMYYPPSVFFDTDLNQYGLAWGTGNRQDLWKCAGNPSPCALTAPDLATGRFYVLIDQGLTPTTPGLPFTAAKLQALTPDQGPSVNLPTAGVPKNFLLTPPSGLQPGWYLDLSAGERVLNEAFALSGVLIFSSYQPSVFVPAATNQVCPNTGDTRVFVLNITNGDAISQQVASQGSLGAAGNPPGTSNRYFVLLKDLGLNINTNESTPILATKGNPNPTLPPAISAALQDIMKNVAKIMPSNCRFSSKRINITITDTFNVQYPGAAVPECIIEKNWKEF